MSKLFCVLDYETRSKADITKVGAWEYSIHPSTRILCIGWKIAPFEQLLTTKTKVWTRHSNEPIPTRLLQALHEKDTTLVAHNAGFERFITMNVLPRYLPKGALWTIQDIPIERWECTASMAAAHALPRNLDGACKVLDLHHQKDSQGKLLIRRHSIPQKLSKNRPIIWNNHETGLNDMALYCQRDVDAEAEIFVTLPRLIPMEKKVWALNQRINTRGVFVDRPLVETALDMITGESADLNRRANQLTGGIAPTRRVAILNWLTTQGLSLPNLQAKTVDDALTSGLAQGEARELLGIRQLISKTSTAKYQAFDLRTRSDSRLRDLQLYHGASTGREAGMGVQPHNFPRGMLKDPDWAIARVLEGDRAWVRALVGDVMPVLSSCLRGCLRATPGHDLYCGDFNAIEARVVFWLANHPEGLKLFADGVDPYVVQASIIFGVPVSEVTDDQRFVGKQSILGCGFGMGDKKFRMQCKSFGQDVSEALAKRAVQSYRKSHWPVVKLWGNLERAAIAAVKNPGKAYLINHTRWFMRDKFLYCELPSGRRLAYFNPRVKYDPTPWGEKRPVLYFWANENHHWHECASYGGLLAENVTQAVARDCMVLGQLRTEQHGYIPLISVHDELLAERKSGGNLEEFERLMSQVPEWAKGLPIKVKAWKGERYRK